MTRHYIEVGQFTSGTKQIIQFIVIPQFDFFDGISSTIQIGQIRERFDPRNRFF